METKFVRAVFDLDCDWEGLPPIYRIWVNDELFAERTWIWTQHFLRENLHLQAPPGIYSVRLEVVGPSLAEFKTTDFKIVDGYARWLDHERLEILA